MNILLKKLTLNTILIGLLLVSFASATVADKADGKKIAFDRKKGNCLACHVMGDGDMAGNVGPPLIAMKIRFPDRAILKAQIWDATAKNPISIMPPFGKHYVLTDDEIESLLDYLYTL
ncbi:MAG: sulfur oxidation c-type cytochrome SoxX [Cycloclasticus sp. symbiont of Poecilosclerida sp. N]|nr:MAG: sulfur oxidation c-type cytochrome SoxX [Cycloclasticus sp. symbiont of Poecilosclerida sp. N]